MKRVIQWVVAAGLGAYCAHADFIVAPNDRETVSGSSFLLNGFQTPGNFQVVYASRNFTGPVEITGIAFRLEAASLGLSYDAVLPRVTINFSTYSRTITEFNPNSYSANKGADDKVVFDGGVTWSTTDLPTAPNPFDLAIAFSQPFTYDPARGALLMHYVVPGPVGGTMRADFHDHGDATIGWTGIAGGNLLGTLVTRFKVTSVPEPRISALILAGGMIFLAGRWKLS